MEEKSKGVILLNNLFSGEYINDNIGGEIINMYQSDNGKFYIYVNPYGYVASKWDNRIKHVLFIRSIGNGDVKVIAKAEIKEQILLNATRNKKNGFVSGRKKYSPENITYGGIQVNELEDWPSYFVTFEAEGIYKAKTDIYLTLEKKDNQPKKNTFVLKNIQRINNQSQKLYIKPDDENCDYKTMEGIIQNPDLWEDNTVGKVQLSESKDKTEDTAQTESFLSIIKKENDELVNSNLLAHFLEKDKGFGSDFVKEVLGIDDKKVINGTPKITRESIGNIDLCIEVDNHVIVIENKIKCHILGNKENSYSQLGKYIKKVKEHFEDIPEENFHFFILRPNYNNEDYSCFEGGNSYTEIKYSQIDKIIDRDSRLPYWDEFRSVVKKHSSEYNNLLFELMNERFIEKIKQIKQLVN